MTHPISSRSVELLVRVLLFDPVVWVEELLSERVVFDVRTLRVALFWVVSLFVSVPVVESTPFLFSEPEDLVVFESFSLVVVVSPPVTLVVVVLFDVVLSVRLSVF